MKYVFLCWAIVCVVVCLCFGACVSMSVALSACMCRYADVSVSIPVAFFASVSLCLTVVVHHPEVDTVYACRWVWVFVCMRVYIYVYMKIYVRLLFTVYGLNSMLPNMRSDHRR